MKNLIRHKSGFISRFKKRHSLRLHMSLILVATICSGFLATRTMLALHLENVLLRYPLAVVCAYLVFFLCMKLWLQYVAPSPVARKDHGNSADVLDLLPDLPVSVPADGLFRVGGVFRGGGGGFDGGGATGNFGEAAGAIRDSGTEILSGGIEAAGDAAGEAASALGEEGGILAMVVLAVLAALMAVIVGAGAYLVYEAPFILSEAAFEFILAAGLVRGTRRIDSADWIGSVFKTTCKPFALTLALALLAGYLMHVYFPGVTRISELLSRL